VNDSYVLMTDNTGYSETSKNIYPTTQCKMTVGSDRQNHQKRGHKVLNE
jgi:hypothetical protein